jgi:hypothetical protein
VRKEFRVGVIVAARIEFAVESRAKVEFRDGIEFRFGNRVKGSVQFMGRGLGLGLE